MKLYLHRLLGLHVYVGRRVQDMVWSECTICGDCHVHNTPRLLVKDVNHHCKSHLVGIHRFFEWLDEFPQGTSLQVSRVMSELSDIEMDLKGYRRVDDYTWEKKPDKLNV